MVISCQYQEEIDTLNQVARHRPRSSLVLGIQQENRQIRQLQLENKGRRLFSVVTVISVNGGTFVLFYFLITELRTSLEEHQSALELIMTKYREQVFRLLMASKRDDPAIVSQLKEQHTTVSKTHNYFPHLSACKTEHC